MAAVGSIIPNYIAAPHGVGYSDKAVKPQDSETWQTFEKMPNWETFPDEWSNVRGYF